MVYVGDKTDHPFFFGMGYAGNLIEDEPTRDNGLYLPESVVAKLPDPPKKREIGFNAAQVWLQQKDDQRQHRNRD